MAYHRCYRCDADMQGPDDLQWSGSKVSIKHKGDKEKRFLCNDCTWKLKEWMNVNDSEEFYDAELNELFRVRYASMDHAHIPVDRTGISAAASALVAVYGVFAGSRFAEEIHDLIRLFDRSADAIDLCETP